MVAASILPATIHNGQLFFLFGKENDLEDSAKGYSDFGGGVESGEHILQTALREASEELTGFLGNQNDIRKHVQKHGGFYKIQFQDDDRMNYNVHIMFVKYDPNLPKYYNATHRFIWNSMDRKYLSRTKIWEKIEINWFTPSMMRKRRSEFRGFYRKIVDELYKESPKIKAFLRQHNRHTRGKTLVRVSRRHFFSSNNRTKRNNNNHNRK